MKKVKIILLILLFSVVSVYGQKQEYKFKGIKWSYDKQEKTEQYYTEGFEVPYLVGKVVLYINEDKNIPLQYSKGDFLITFRTPPLSLSTIDKISFYNKDMDEIMEIWTIDLKFIPSQNSSSKQYNITTLLDYLQTQKLKKIIEKYKNINIRIYINDSYIEYEIIDGIEDIINLINIHNEIFDKQLKIIFEQLNKEITK